MAELIGLALSWLPIAMLVVLAVGWFAVGARRWLRIGTFLLLLVLHAEMALVYGWLPALGRLAVLLLITSVAALLVTRSWRTPRVVRYALATPEIGPPWPLHATRHVERWTGELATLGFETPRDVWNEWRVLGSYRNTRLRVLRHATEPIWALISANARPKSMGRALLSRLADGRLLETCDRLSDRAVTSDPISVRQRCATTATMTAMFTLHRARLSRLGPARTPGADVVAEMTAAREEWITAALAAGSIHLDGDNVALTWASALRTVTRVLLGWLR